MEGSLVAYKVFTNGSTLPASDINNNLMNQSVIVFSNAAARTAAITVPLEGMLSYLEDVNQYQSYNGSAWVPAFGDGFITSNSFTAQSSVNIDNVFTTDYRFYDIYLTFTGTSITTLAAQLRTAGASPTDLTTSTYSTQDVNASGTTLTTSNSGAFPNWNLGAARTTLGYTTFTLANPAVATATLGEARLYDAGFPWIAKGFINSTASAFGGFRLFVSSGNITGTVSVFGRKA
jgi:hypothetical protein